MGLARFSEIKKRRRFLKGHAICDARFSAGAGDHALEVGQRDDMVEGLVRLFPADLLQSSSGKWARRSSRAVHKRRRRKAYCVSPTSG